MKKILYFILFLPALAYGHNGCDSAKNITSLASKIAFYRKNGDWQLWAGSINEAIKKYPPKQLGKEFGSQTGLTLIDPNDDWTLNVVAWDAFLHCMDKNVLKSALKWSELSIKISPNMANGDPGIVIEYLDTKANLLYKIGKVKKAIKTEKSDFELTKDEYYQKVFTATVEKMENGQKTW